jgi:two-component system CheB/CheR fusion protein
MSEHEDSEMAPGPDAHPEGPPFPVVGIGASAGGLEAFQELLDALPQNPGLAILFVAHLDPKHKSLLPEILARATPMPVLQVKEGMPVELNHIYVIPPATNMAIADGHLALTPREAKAGPHMPIDHLFRSLASIQKSRAIGVLLSGNGTDGSLGFQSIKGEGGITFAQDEKSAKHAGMPRAAAADGNVDFVLAPHEIARELARLAGHPYTRGAEPPAAPRAPAEGDPVAEIIGLLRERTAVDFSHYKMPTIRRRIQRRMALANFDNPRDYLKLLKRDAAEVDNLYHDFLIRVSQFFRDPEAFEVVKHKIFPALLKDRPRSSPVRIWVAGCATGEEAYSLAILLSEALEGRPEAVPVKILATDLNESALEKARAGVYLDNIEIDVTPERLRRFFTRLDGRYQISKAIREMCVFSRHNLTVDPPFSHLDLVSCRNVLIYMDTALQRRVLPVLHYALNPSSYLFLGASESVGAFTDLFEPADGKHRIFHRKAVPAGLAPELHEFTRPGLPHRPPGGPETPPVWSALDVQREADRILLARYAPVGVVVDEAMTVLQFRGRTAPYLEPAPGLATLDLFRMLREGLLAEVRGVTTRAKAENVSASCEARCVGEKGETRQVRIEVIPFKVPPSGLRFFLVLFHEPGRAAAAPPPPEPAPAATLEAAQLKQETAALRDYLQSVIEEHESTSEELKSANEEILSANEELQSTNEELQTAKEEAQSANEELATVNEELRHRNAELARVNNDLVNLLAGVNIPIVMVGRDLRVRRFTPQAEKTFSLIQTDVGRPITDIKPNLDVDDLPGLITRVIDTLTPYEGEAKGGDGRLYSLRIRPYVTTDSKIEGASVVLVDIDAIRRKLEGQKGPSAG